MRRCACVGVHDGLRVVRALKCPPHPFPRRCCFDRCAWQHRHRKGAANAYAPGAPRACARASLLCCGEADACGRARCRCCTRLVEPEAHAAGAHGAPAPLKPEAPAGRAVSPSAPAARRPAAASLEPPVRTAVAAASLPGAYADDDAGARAPAPPPAPAPAPPRLW